MKDHSISIYQDRYYTYVVEKYLDNATFKARTEFYKTTLLSNMIFKKLVHLPVIIKLRSELGNSIFTTELVLDH